MECITGLHLHTSCVRRGLDVSAHTNKSEFLLRNCLYSLHLPLLCHCIVGLYDFLQNEIAQKTGFEKDVSKTEKECQLGTS